MMDQPEVRQYMNYLHGIESIKTASMENVSTGVLEKIKNNI